jgi:hypothetical protein
MEILKKINIMLPNCSSITKLQFGNIKFGKISSKFPLILFKTKNDISVTRGRRKAGTIHEIHTGVKKKKAPKAPKSD